jgi:pilus assembly protein CpaD
MTTRKLALTAAALMPLVWLGGCKTGGAEIDDYYRPAMHYERYPVEVAKGSVRLDVATKRPTLSAHQEEAVVKFGQQAVSSAVGSIEVRKPSGATADSVAAEVTELLVQTGVDPGAIVHRDYSGSRGAPVIIAFERKFAVTTECGDWSDNITKTGKNEPYENFGCAAQHNIAAVVANPEDFETPRAATPPDAMRRYQVFVDYRKPKNTATSMKDSEVQKVSDVAE